MIKTPLFIVASGFASAFYWSSTENNANNAWNQNFSGGGQNNDNKNNTNQVRCVRGFKQNKKTKQAWVMRITQAFFYTKRENDFIAGHQEYIITIGRVGFIISSVR